MILTLIGYRGSGKTTIAAPLAARLGIPWKDADDLIEQQAGCSIREIFVREGEPGFRRRERDVYIELLQQPSLILAAGGGAILNPDTRRDIVAAGPVIWLRAPVATLAERIAADVRTADRRPALAGGGLEEIAGVLARREPLYQECASLVLDTGSGSIEELVDQIVEHYRGWVDRQA